MSNPLRPIDRTDEHTPTMKLEDVGTRFQHYTELIALWNEGLDAAGKMVQRGTVNPQKYLTMMMMLFGGIDSLTKLIDTLSGFNTGIENFKLRKELNDIAKDAEVWKAGRGADND